jgi:hypothetical protein
MSGQKLNSFQAVVVRYVHDQLTGESINLGIVLVGSDTGTLWFKSISSYRRVTNLFPEADSTHLRYLLKHMKEYCEKRSSEANLNLLTDGESLKTVLDGATLNLFREQGGTIQFSDTIRGLTRDSKQTCASLFARYVSKYESTLSESSSRKDSDIWNSLETKLKQRNVFLSAGKLESSHFSVDFEASWQNGKSNLLKTISFDLSSSNQIREKAASWAGKIQAVEPVKQNADVHLVIGIPKEEKDGDISLAYDDGMAILTKLLPTNTKLYTEEQEDELVAKILYDTEHH